MLNFDADVKKTPARHRCKHCLRRAWMVKCEVHVWGPVTLVNPSCVVWLGTVPGHMASPTHSHTVCPTHPAGEHQHSQGPRFGAHWHTNPQICPPTYLELSPSGHQPSHASIHSSTNSPTCPLDQTQNYSHTEPPTHQHHPPARNPHTHTHGIHGIPCATLVQASPVAVGRGPGYCSPWSSGRGPGRTGSETCRSNTPPDTETRHFRFPQSSPWRHPRHRHPPPLIGCSPQWSVLSPLIGFQTPLNPHPSCLIGRQWNSRFSSNLIGCLWVIPRDSSCPGLIGSQLHLNPLIGWQYPFCPAPH